MIYTYEALKDHVTSFHPQLLNDFIQGWESIDFNTRLNWQAHGLSTPEKEEISDYDDYHDHWMGWHKVESNGCNSPCWRHRTKWIF